jgi:site-specific DNA-methyltransferase (adenine-specific)
MSCIHQGDLLAYLREHEWLALNGFLSRAHAVFCDPPYFLGSITKRFGKPNSAPAKYGSDGLFQRQSKGFMGQAWDGFESPEHYQAWVTEWSSLLRLFVYPGALLLAFGGPRTYHRLAAGLEDAGWIISDCCMWSFANGFPKGHRQALDFRVARHGGRHGCITNDAMLNMPLKERLEYFKLEKKWSGWNIALKPAYEPIVVARAPYSETYADLARLYGTGGINIDGSRINGRWPANFMLDCSCETPHELGCPVNILDQQSGDVKAGGSLSGQEPSKPAGGVVYGRWDRHSWESYNDDGGASRFFFCTKAKTWEREAGLSLTSRKVNDGRQSPIDTPYQRGETKRHNTHPTVKPIQLTEYLARLILPPVLDEPRRLLVPFSGSGSEMIGAHLAGWDEVTGFEQSAEYVDITNQRLEWWEQFETYEQAHAAYKAIGEQQKQVENGQLSLFDEMGA